MGCISKIFKCGSVLTLLFAVFVGLLVNGNLQKWGLFSSLVHYKHELVGMGPAFMTAEELSKAWDYSDIPAESLKGKVALVTGANVGLGYYTSMHLAMKGAHVVMACRTMSKCDKSADQINSKLTGSGSVETMQIDTSSLASVQAFTTQFAGEQDRLDMLVCNAGISMKWEPLSIDGIEMVFATNHLGHFKLYKDLAGLLETTAKMHGHARVVHVSSVAHFKAPPIGVHTNLEDLNTKNQQAAYAQSKLCNLLFSNEVAARAKEKGVRVLSNAAHPGAVDTMIWERPVELVKKSLPPFLQPPVLRLIEQIRKGAMWTSEEGARTQTYLAAAPEIAEQGIAGRYYHPVTSMVPTSPQAQNATLQKALWAFSEQLLADRGF